MRVYTRQEPTGFKRRGIYAQDMRFVYDPINPLFSHTINFIKVFCDYLVVTSMGETDYIKAELDNLLRVKGQLGANPTYKEISNTVSALISFYHDNEDEILNSHSAANTLVSALSLSVVDREDIDERFYPEEVYSEIIINYADGVQRVLIEIGMKASRDQEKLCEGIYFELMKGTISALYKLGESDKATEILHSFRGKGGYDILLENVVSSGEVINRNIPGELIVEYKDFRIEKIARSFESYAKKMDNPLEGLDLEEAEKMDISKEQIIEKEEESMLGNLALVFSTNSRVAEGLGGDMAPLANKLLNLAKDVHFFSKKDNVLVLDHLSDVYRKTNPERTAGYFLFQEVLDREKMKQDTPEEFELNRKVLRQDGSKILRKLAKEIRESYSTLEFKV